MTLTLTLNERLQLLNQYRLLAATDPDNKDTWEEFATIVEYGYEGLYGQLVEFMSTDDSIMTAEECRLVNDILLMYNMIQVALRTQDPPSGTTAESFKFPGFDGNYEAKHLNYAQFFVSQGHGRYPNLFPDGKVPNSHMPTLARAQARLAAWNASADRNQLTTADLARIHAA